MVKLRSKTPVYITLGVFLALASLQGLSALLGNVFYINLSESLPKGVYIRVSKNEAEVGDLALFTLPESQKVLATSRPWLDPNKPFLKRVAALGGKTYCIDKNALYFGKTVVAKKFQVDFEGKSIPSKSGCFEIGKHSFLPLSTYSKRSFDGRYFGDVAITSIITFAKPLITFSNQEEVL